MAAKAYALFRFCASSGNFYQPLTAAVELNQDVLTFAVQTKGIGSAFHLAIKSRTARIKSGTLAKLRMRTGLKFRIEPAQKFDELPVTVLRIALSAYPTVDNVKCGKQCRRSLSHAIVGPGTAAALFERQTGLSLIQSSNLRFFVDAEHDGVLKRIQVNPNYIEKPSSRDGRTAMRP